MRKESVDVSEAASNGARSSGGVQSISRVFDLLEAMADAGGVVGVSQLASMSGLPLPTIHRLVRTLVDLGYVRQEPSREYALGPRLIRLGESASRLVATWADPHLRGLVEHVGESVNLAMLEEDHVTYVAQAPGLHSMRMFTEVGRHAGVHCTAVGKAMLAALPPDRALAIVRRSGLPARTDTTITDVNAFAAELDAIRERGYSLDEQEQEVGVRCVAVAIPGDPVRAGISISGPLTRMSDGLIHDAVPLLQGTAAKLAVELDLVGGSARRGAS